MVLNFNPQDWPAVKVDSDLPSVPVGQLLPDALRARFALPPVWEPEVRHDGRPITRPPAQASVLVPLMLRPEPTVLLTRRTDHLTDHPGQISFPGGRAEAEDKDPVATALREAREEIGLDARHASVLGSLPTYTTITGFVVTPVVALIDPTARWQPDPAEVAEVFEVPLAFLMDPANHRHHVVDLVGGQRTFLSMPWPATEQAGLPAHAYFIWGATAAMLRNFYRFLVA